MLALGLTLLSTCSPLLKTKLSRPWASTPAECKLAECKLAECKLAEFKLAEFKLAVCLRVSNFASMRSLFLAAFKLRSKFAFIALVFIFPPPAPPGIICPMPILANIACKSPIPGMDFIFCIISLASCNSSLSFISPDFSFVSNLLPTFFTKLINFVGFLKSV